MDAYERLVRASVALAEAGHGEFMAEPAFDALQAAHAAPVEARHAVVEAAVKAGCDPNVVAANVLWRVVSAWRWQSAGREPIDW